MQTSAALSRRRFLQALSIAPAAALSSIALPSFARSLPFPPSPERSIALHNIHTGEKASVPYWADGSYIPESLASIDRLLRDYRTGAVAPIDPRLLDLLRIVGDTLGTTLPFEVISGYRSPATNRMLHETTPGVAKRSLHMEGMAIDIRLPGVPLSHLRSVGLSLAAGGVGYYPKSDFVHLDVGAPRAWVG